MRKKIVEFWNRLLLSYDALQAPEFTRPIAPEAEGHRAIAKEGARVTQMVRDALGFGSQECVIADEHDVAEAKWYLSTIEPLEFHEKAAATQQTAFEEEVKMAVAEDGNMCVVRFDFSSYVELRRRRETGAEWRHPEKVSVLGFSVWSRKLDKNPMYVDIATECLIHDSRQAASQVRFALNYLASDNVIADDDVVNLW